MIIINGGIFFYIFIYSLITSYDCTIITQGKRMNAKFLFFSNVYLLNKIILAVFRRIC